MTYLKIREFKNRLKIKAKLHFICERYIFAILENVASSRVPDPRKWALLEKHRFGARWPRFDPWLRYDAFTLS